MAIRSPSVGEYAHVDYNLMLYPRNSLILTETKFHSMQNQFRHIRRNSTQLIFYNFHIHTWDFYIRVHAMPPILTPPATPAHY